MVKEKTKTGRVFSLLGILLVLAAFTLTAYNFWDSWRAEKASRAIVEILEEEIAQEPTSDQYLDMLLGLSGDEENLSNLDMPVLTVEGYDYIGTLIFPSPDLELPVMNDWDYDRLRISPCRYAGSYYTDDLVIAGHNYLKHFTPVKNLPIGEDIYFKNVNGYMIHYVIDDVEVIKPDKIDDMICGDWDMTLFTCTADGQKRFAVRCVRAEIE